MLVFSFSFSLHFYCCFIPSPLFHGQFYANISTHLYTFLPQPHTSPSHSLFVWQVHHLLDSTRIYKLRRSHSRSPSSCSSSSSSVWCLPSTWPGAEECCSCTLKLLLVGYLLVSLSAFLAFLNMNSIESRGQCFNLEPPLKPPQPLHNHITIQCKCHRDECTRIHTAQSRLVGVMIITNHLYVKRFFVGFKVNLIFYQNTHDHVERAQA